jgi:polar amino acid transport system substrate-binding protein
MYTHPASRLQQFAAKEPELWRIISSYYTDDNRIMTTPVSKTRAENLHNEFLYLTGELKDSLDKVVAEPLNEQTIATYRQCSSRLEIAVSLENNLFSLLEQTAAPLFEHSADGSKLQQLMHESLRTMLDTAFLAIESGDQMDFNLLEGLTSKYRERFNDLRSSYAARENTQEDAHLWTVLHSTHKMERIIYLLGDYVRIRLNKKEFTTGSATTRKTQQSIVN